MSFFTKSLELLEESDLQTLLDNEVPEGKTIDYKEALHGNSDSDKKEFLYDISSFANASGGHLIFGIKEDRGLPTDICGLDIPDADATILDLENRIRDGIAPRIPGVAARAISLSDNRVVIVFRIPRSFSRPHMTTFKNASKFYSRNSAGKYQLDVGELRTAFTLSQNTIDRIRNGIIEAVDAYMVARIGDDPPNIQREYEEKVIQGVEKYNLIQKKLGVEPPLFIMLSLLEVKDYSMSSNLQSNLDRLLPNHPIDRNNLLVPEVMIENFEFKPSQVMKPIFDAVWNACGYPGSQNYDDSGNWRG